MPRSGGRLPDKMAKIQAASARWKGAVIVCRKCGKRLKGGFGSKGKTPLAKELRRYLGVKKGRKAGIGIVETGCLGLCPKGGVTVIDGSRPGEWLVIPAGTSVEEVADRLHRSR